MTSAPSTSLRLCHLSDVNLGYRRYHRTTKTGFNQREVDVSQAFAEAIDLLQQRKPDLVLIAGDLFNSVRPSNAVISFCFRQLKRLTQSSKVPVVLIAGNRESPRRSDTGSLLRLFREIEGVVVADTQIERFSFPDISTTVTAVPHVAMAAHLHRQLRADDRARFNILAAHGQLCELIPTDSGGAPLSLGEINPHEWDYIALGHQHSRKRVALNASYCGSLEHTEIDLWQHATAQKGFLEIELPSGKERFHVLTGTREIVLLSPIDASLLEPSAIMGRLSEALEAVVGGIEGKILRAEVYGLTSQKLRALDHRLIRSWRAAALNLTLDFRLVREGRDFTPQKHTLQSAQDYLSEELRTFCNARLLGKTGEQVHALLQEYLREREGRDEASQSES